MSPYFKKQYFALPVLLTLLLGLFASVNLIQKQNFEVSQAAGNTYFVATNGNNANSGTQSSPWRTIQYAVDRVSAGDTIFIRAGTYNESLEINRSGNQSSPITITHYGSESVTINGGSNLAIQDSFNAAEYIVVDGLTLESTGSRTVDIGPWGVGSTHWTFKNNTIYGSIVIHGSYNLLENNTLDGSKYQGEDANAVRALGRTGYDITHHNIFRGNTIHDYGSRGLWSQNWTHDDVFENNYIYDIGDMCIDTDGFGNVEWRHTIRGNRLSNCEGIELENTFDTVVENNMIESGSHVGIAIINYGGEMSGYGPERCAVGGENNQYGDIDGDNDCRTNPTGNIIRQNIIYNVNSYHGGIVSFFASDIEIVGNTVVNVTGDGPGINIGRQRAYPEIAVSARNIEIQNNIIYNTQRGAIALDKFESAFIDRNNLIYQPNGYPQYVVDGQNYTLAQYQQTSSKGQNSLYVDPRFVNLASNNFHLQSTSPAIDAGAPLGLNFDLDGNPRPQGAGNDIGAYEYTGTQPTFSPSPSPPSLVGDFDRDGDLDITDIAMMLSVYTQLSLAVNDTNRQFDVDGSGTIDIADIALVLSKYTLLVVYPE